MKISVVITVLNEEKSIGPLLDALLTQSLKPDKIVIVDGGSKDKTREILRHYQKKDKRIKVLFQKSSRAEGRNLGVEVAKNEVITMTDAGCIPDKDWLKNLTAPFKNPEIDISAGFYKMGSENSFEKAESIFLGILPSKFDISFLPSTRSIAFRKEAWERIGGFEENLTDTAEDTLFNYTALKLGMKIARVKNAVVEWGIPKNLKEFSEKLYRYAKGDAKSKIWFYPAKNVRSHNIKVIFIFLRYLLGLIFLCYAFRNVSFVYLFTSAIFAYLLFSFRKVYLGTHDMKSALYGVILQIVSDFSVMAGFIAGTIGR